MSEDNRNFGSPETEHYWHSAANGKFVLKACRSCGEYHFYPRSICPHCFSSDTEWIESAGKGRIYSFSVVRRTASPIVVAYVALDEGVTMLTNIVGCDPDGVRIGARVDVDFAEREGRTVPVFRLEEGARQ